VIDTLRHLPPNSVTHQDVFVLSAQDLGLASAQLSFFGLIPDDNILSINHYSLYDLRNANFDETLLPNSPLQMEIKRGTKHFSLTISQY